jgi:hypothetical protein
LVRPASKKFVLHLRSEFKKNLIIYFSHMHTKSMQLFDNSTALYKDLKTLHPGGDSNQGSSFLEADAMTTLPRCASSALFAFVRVM